MNLAQNVSFKWYIIWLMFHMFITLGLLQDL